jgi:hypothetical protein
MIKRRNNIRSLNLPSDSTFASFAALQNENGGVKLNDILTWDMCPDF